MGQPTFRWLTLLCLAATATASCSGDRTRERILVRGSDSEVNLVQRMAEVFMARHPGVSISVTGGGSGTGIAALIGRSAHVANSSRPLKPIEKLFAHRKGVAPVATRFATDALTVIVHPQNTIAALSIEQVGAAYRGEITDWSRLGGRAGPVVTYGRQSNSGTYGFFRDAVVRGEFSTLNREMNGNAQIVAAVASDPGAIGYVAVGYLRSSAAGVRAVPISEGADGVPISPLDADAVIDGRYPIARPLFQYTDGPPSGALRDFMRFELSDEGQAIATEMGFYPLVRAGRGMNPHLDGDASRGGG